MTHTGTISAAREAYCSYENPWRGGATRETRPPLWQGWVPGYSTAQPPGWPWQSARPYARTGETGGTGVGINNRAQEPRYPAPPLPPASPPPLPLVNAPAAAADRPGGRLVLLLWSG